MYESASMHGEVITISTSVAILVARMQRKKSEILFFHLNVIT